jgi:ABC-type oligopeptide transport system substrate-binding subunit
MKRFGLAGILLCVTGLFLSGCASTEDTTTTGTKEAVPGETIPDGVGLSPSAGAGGAGANVHF